MSDITRARGDTRRIQKTVKENGVAINIENWTFMLTISREEDPLDVTEEVAQIAGVLVEAGNGTVKFTPTLADVDWVGVYFYDIEAVDSDGGISTLDKGRWVNRQDITKSDEEFEYTPPEAPADGAIAVLDGSLDYLMMGNSYPTVGSGDRDDITYQTRDTRRVIRGVVTPFNTYAVDLYWPYGPDFPRSRFGVGSWEFKLTAYINRVWFSMYLPGADSVGYIRAGIDTRGGSLTAGGEGWISVPATGGVIQTTPAAPSTGGWTDGDWYVVGLRVESDGLLYYTVHPESEDDAWIVMDAVGVMDSMFFPLRVPSASLIRETPENPASVYDLWKYEWRRLS